MNKYIKPFIYTLEFLIISSFLITLLNYIGIFNTKLTSIISISSIVLSFFIIGYLTGKKSIENGWLNGLKEGSLLLLIIIIIDILLKVKFDYKLIIYYLILLLLSIIGSMLGISKKNTNK